MSFLPFAHFAVQRSGTEWLGPPTFWRNFDRLLLNPYVKGCTIRAGGTAREGSSIQARPPEVKDEHIERVCTIQRQAAEGTIDKKTAEAEMLAVAEEVGEDAFEWIVRRVPVYDEETGRFVTLDTYMRDMADEMGVPEGSRLADDPIGTTVDLMFDEPSPDEMMDWLGFDDLP